MMEVEPLRANKLDAKLALNIKEALGLIAVPTPPQHSAPLASSESQQTASATFVDVPVLAGGDDEGAGAESVVDRSNG